MIGYIIYLVLSVIVTFIINALIVLETKQFSIPYAFIGSISNFAIIFGLDVVISFILHKVSAKYYNPFFKRFHVSKWERRFLVKIGIKKWKDKVPDMGQLCDFKKNELKGTEEEYLYKFLVESCYAEVIHIGMALIGILDIFIWPIGEFWNFVFPMILINLFANIPPIFIQRYNRPRLLDLYIRKYKKEAKPVK